MFCVLDSWGGTDSPWREVLVVASREVRAAMGSRRATKEGGRRCESVLLCCQVPDGWHHRWHLPATCFQHHPFSMGSLGLLCGWPPTYLSLLDDESRLKSIRLQEVVSYCSCFAFLCCHRIHQESYPFSGEGGVISCKQRGKILFVGKKSQRWALVEFLALFLFFPFFFFFLQRLVKQKYICKKVTGIL